MTDHDDISTPTEAYWTGGRLAGGIVILGLAAALIVWMVWSSVAPVDGWDGPSDFALTADNTPAERKRWREELLESRRQGMAKKLNSEYDSDGLLIPAENILRGGPRKDGIPSLTNPNTTSIANVDFLDPDARVVGITIKGESRAYPIHVLIHHEIINDELGDTPVAVMYCPLCDSVSVMNRKLDDNVYEFGVTGLLTNSNVIMYDRQDNALWSQLGFKALSGPNAGRTLTHLPWVVTTFEAWQREHPDSTIVNFDTGHTRNYQRMPYGDYFENDDLVFPVDPLDNRLPVKTLVVGIRRGESTLAVPLTVIQKHSGELLEVELDGVKITLKRHGNGEGVEVVEIPEDVQVVQTFWFAWAAFHPDTAILQPE